MNNHESHANYEHRERPKPDFDAVIVLGANIKKVQERFSPTDYTSPTEMGLSGGGIRLAAAAELFIKGAASKFVFSGGRSARAKVKYGEDIPNEAQIYGDQFSKILLGMRSHSEYQDELKDIPDPEIIHEDRSNNTETNIREVLKLIKNSPWQKVAILTSEYHLPRVKALYEAVLKDHPEINTEISFLSAEETVKELRPGKYDEIIRKTNESPDAKLRLANEAKGLQDFIEGRYKLNHIDLD